MTIEPLLSSNRESDISLYGEMLHADLREIFNAEGTDFVASTRICSRLVQFEHRPWLDLNGQPITPRRLADLLRSFDICPRSNGTERGYRASDFEDAFGRYAPK